MTADNTNTARSQKQKRVLSAKERFKRERRFGQIALKSRKISKNRLKECLLYQQEIKKQGFDKKIGQVLIERKYLLEKQVEELLKKQRALDLIRKREFGIARDGNNRPVGNLVKKYKAGEVIFIEDDNTNHDLYIVQTGEVGVYRNSIQLGKRSDRGAFLGTTSCLLKTPRIATAVAMKDSTLLKIPEDDVQIFFAKNPQMSLKLSSVLAERVAKLTKKYVGAVSELPGSKGKFQESVLIEGAIDNPAQSEFLLEDNRYIAEKTKIDATQNKIVEKEGESSSNHGLSFDGKEAIGEPADTYNHSSNASGAELSFEKENDGNLGVSEGAPAVGSSDINLSPSAGDSFDSIAKEECNVGDGVEEVEDGLENLAKDDPLAAVSRFPETFVELPQGEIQEIISKENPLEFSNDIRQVLDDRLEMYVALDSLAEKRNELEEAEETTEKAKNELASLRRELIKIPPYDRLKMKRDKLSEMVVQPADDSKKTPITEDVIEAYKISIEQKTLFLGWYEGMPNLIEKCAKAAVGQVMYKVMKRVGVNPDEVFGWAVYVMAMQEYAAELKEDQKEYKEKLKALIDEEEANNKGGLLGIFKKKQEADEEELEAKEIEKAELEKSELVCCSKINGVNKELASIEPVMVDAFWDVYGALGLKLVKGVDKECEMYVRAYLRWGILGFAEDFIHPEILEKLLVECAKGSAIEEFGMESNYILYADEVIELTANKVLLPSPNEELEMNERNSPRWKLDRAYRRVVGGKFYLQILKNLESRLEEDANEKRNARIERENKLADLSEDDPEIKEKTTSLKKSVQALKVATVKCEKLVEKVRDDMLVKVQSDIDYGNESMAELDMPVYPEDLAKHEIACIRRFSRLVAKLREPFLPFTLRDRFNPEIKTPNTREEMLKIQKDIEEKDPLIFKENMLSSMKKNNRIQIRMAPFIHLLPVSGVMGFLVAPRTDTYSGKLMLPSYYERTGMREAVAIDTFSDFRYDTSKEQAGNDVMNSDTIVAAYAEVRWLMRKKEKEVRQKAGIFMEENERTNFRRHYAMYINSADEGGKQLFFKCPDLYELIINKFIELPEGVEVLARG